MTNSIWKNLAIYTLGPVLAAIGLGFLLGRKTTVAAGTVTPAKPAEKAA